MATADYATILAQARQLPAEEQQRLIAELEHQTEDAYGTPVAERVSGDERAAILAALKRIDETAAAIATEWPAGLTAVEAVREQRREL